jgi:NAD(P)-dependent dehydrogenase (short-subunit alcohol dehydrogenase family)
MAMNPEQLSSTRVLVTGGTSGLGRSMAVALAESGAHVALTGRDQARADTTAAQVGAIGIALDVRDDASVRAGVEAAYEQLGGLDVLICNAGIGMRTVNPRFMTDPQPFWEVSPDGFRDVVETKVTGSFLVARAVAPRMLEAGGGRIVVISMNEQTMTRRGFVPYGPSGAGVEALARVMAADLAGTTVTVNILLPGGATATGMLPDGVPAEMQARLLDPGIMGPPIVWLCSAQAAGVHDQRILATEFSG